jgi:hypothetical protein
LEESIFFDLVRQNGFNTEGVIFVGKSKVSVFKPSKASDKLAKCGKIEFGWLYCWIVVWLDGCNTPYSHTTI